jgi:pyruvate dehydrogenase E2 component (dihydrolipoamide acetyltransferase)
MDLQDIKGIAENYSAKGSASSTAATEETTSAPADVATPVTQEASTDGQRILASH